MFRAIFVFAVITNEIGVHFIFCLYVTFVIQRTPWLRIDDEVFSCDSYDSRSEQFLFLLLITNEIGAHVIFPLDVTFVIQRTPWLPIDDKVFLLILKTRVPSDFCFCSNYKWTCSSCHIPFCCDICHKADTLAPNWWWSFFCNS